MQMINIPDTASHFYVTRYPEGHSSKPWEVAYLDTESNYWFKGLGNTLEEACNGMTQGKLNPPVTMPKASFGETSKASTNDLLNLLDL